MEYPTFSPPIHLAIKPPKKWSNLEAKTYFEWFLSSLESRVDKFFNFLDLDRTLECEILLREAQDKCEKLLATGEFTQILPTGPKLNNMGYALAADLGLVVASMLIKQSKGQVSWSILKKPKSSQSYNLPVLIGFNTVHLDPIGGSIAEMSWIVKGNINLNAWVKIYKYWSTKIV